MACETAVVATATGGIPEVVVRRRHRAPGADRAGHRRHRHAAGPRPYVADFAAALNEVVADPERAAAMGRAGRQRAIDAFSWAAIAEKTVEIYQAQLG